MRRLARITLVVLLLLLTTSAAAFSGSPRKAPADHGTGGVLSYQKTLETMGPEWAAENARIEALKKDTAVREWNEKVPAKRATPGEFTAQLFVDYYLNTSVIGQGSVHAADVWNTWTSTHIYSAMDQYAGPNRYTTDTITRYPVDNKNRLCTHCGVASTLVLLRYLGTQGLSNVSDIDADNGTAILKLGVGWKNGQYDTATWHIQQCCDGASGSEYENNMGQAVTVLNDRRTDLYYYVASSKGSIGTMSQLDAFIRYAIDRNHPVMLSIQTNLWTPYNTPYAGGHVLVIDGYQIQDSTGATTAYRVNDVNNCAFGWSAGKYTVSPSTVWNAMTQLYW